MIEALNTDCFCVSLDREALRQAIDDDPAARGLSALIEERCPHLFAALPVYVSRRKVDQMAKIIAAVEEVVALPAYREQVLSYAPDIARFDPGARGVFTGYDFHLGAAGPKLIEINTNAGGALLNAVLGRAQRACCEDVASLVSGPVPAERLDCTIFEMFIEEWRLAGRGGVPARIAIVDDRPEEQFLHPEFLLFERLFRSFGVQAWVLAPEQLTFRDGELRDANGPIDLVCNRMTDFSLQEAAHAALRAAYLAGAAVVTPHPRAHALYADKRNLAVLSDESRLAALGVRREAIEVLLRGVPRTRLVTAALAEELWADRRKLFFKPAAGFGSKAAYRGDKLTRRVWSEVQAGIHVAQELIPHPRRRFCSGAHHGRRIPHRRSRWRRSISRQS
ncbi:MAG: hypothetical protein EPO20_22870 [Betaproteobacteria bacterium]|nr:MAG: hypothetical protein EPO20_22870 [Betaproteobacteria bacterium]